MKSNETKLIRKFNLSISESYVYVAVCSLGLLFLVMAVGFRGASDEPGAQRTRTESTNFNSKVRGLVNKNLQADQSLLQLRANQVKSENFEARAKGIHFDTEVLDQVKVEMIDTAVHDGSGDLYEDIHGDESIYNSELSPSEKIEAKIHKMRTLEEYDYQQKLAYIEAFVENAWKQGYQVRINEDLEVVRIQEVDNKGPYRGKASLNKAFGGE